VRGKKDGKRYSARAGGDQQYFDAMSVVTRAAHWHDVECTRTAEQLEDAVNLRLVLPTLLVETEKMFLYDDRTKSLREEAAFRLHPASDAGDHVVRRSLCVLRVSALPAMIAWYDEAIERLAEAAFRHLPALHTAAAKVSGKVRAKQREDEAHDD
jgi:hypothetical protein